MADMIEGKTWFKNNMAPYLVTIKNAIESRVNELGGSYLGSSDTFNTLPDATGKPDGDWSILSATDGSHDSGMYIIVSESWEFATGLQIEEADDTDYTNSASGKYVSPAKLNPLLENKANVNGNKLENFSVKEANIGGNNALSVSQFSSDPITNAEADSDWSSL